MLQKYMHYYLVTFIIRVIFVVLLVIHSLVNSKNMKLIALLAVILCAAFFLAMGNNNYSPIDTYIKGAIETHVANEKAAQEAKAFIDSINLK